MMFKPCLYIVVICLFGLSPALADSLTEHENTSESKTTQIPSKTPPTIAPTTVPESGSITAIKKPALKKPPSLPQSGSLLPQLFQVSLGLLFVLGLIIALAWLFRRYGQPQYAIKGNFKVLGGVHLTTREKVVLLQVGNQQLLLGVAPGRVNTLHILEQPLDLNTMTSGGESAFAKRLSLLIQGKKT